MTTRTTWLLVLSLALPLACKGKGASETPEDELELPPEAPKTAKTSSGDDEEGPPKTKKMGDEGAKQVEPAKVVTPQDRDQNLEKTKMEKARKLSAKAKDLLRAGQLDKAIAEARLALREHEQNVEAMLVVAECFYKQGKHELVLSVANSILKVDAKVLTPTEKSQALNLKGFAYLQAGQRRDAFSAFKSAAETDDKNASAWNNLGVQYMWQAETATAEQCFAYVITLDDKFAEAQLNYGVALRANKKFAEAEQAFLAAQKLRPDWAEVDFNLGVLYLDGDALESDIVKRYENAITQLERYKTKVGKGGSEIERSKAKNKGPTDAMGNELVSVAQADLYIKAANKGIESEKRRRERDEKRKQDEPAPEPVVSEPSEPGSETPPAETPSQPTPSQPSQPTQPSQPAQPSQPSQPSQPPPSQPSQPQKPGAQKPGAQKPAEPKPVEPKPSDPPASNPPSETPPQQTNPPQPQKPKPQKPGGGG